MRKVLDFIWLITGKRADADLTWLEERVRIEEDE